MNEAASQSDLPVYKVSVRDLAEYAWRSGDLTSYTASRIRGVEGTRVHQRVQGARPESYQAEVTVRHVEPCEVLCLEISGRIDGVQIEDGTLIVEEIKSTRRPLDREFPEQPAHWAQAMVYAWIYASQNAYPAAEVTLTYAEVDSLHVESRVRSMDLAELRAAFLEVVERFERWARRQTEWEKERDAAIAQTPFPYPRMRRGQQDMMEAVEQCIAEQHKLFAEAPTGIGKTMSALYPALQALAGRQLDRVFYLCAKTSGKAVAEQAFADLRAAGLRCKTLTLTAKDKVLCKGGLPCIGPDCEHTLGYFDRINDAVADMFLQDAWTREAVEAVAQKHRVCTFHFSLDLSLWADALICDYNYAFDPRVYLRRYFDDRPGRYAFLVDEAHNLVDRARDMFSAEVERVDFETLRKALRKDLPRLARQCGSVIKRIQEIGADAEEQGGAEAFAWPDKPEALVRSLRGFSGAAEEWLSGNEEAPWRELLLQGFFTANAFLQASERFDERFVRCYEKRGARENVRLFCLDPSYLLGQAFQRCDSAVLFSATLSPMDYYGELLARRKEDAVINLPSPFPPEHLALHFDTAIATTWRERGASYAAIARHIQDFTAHENGNYLVFFPSYAYLNDVLEALRKIHPFDDLLVQRARMSEKERDLFIRAFSQPSHTTRIGLAVMGGVFGEGIDLIGDQLIGAIVVGVGLPQVGLERDLIRGYFQQQGRDGFDYAYTFPGWTRVLQAVGRVIRSEEDRGRVLLIDRRLGQGRYRKLFPAHWA